MKTFIAQHAHQLMVVCSVGAGLLLVMVEMPFILLGEWQVSESNIVRATVLVLCAWLCQHGAYPSLQLKLALSCVALHLQEAVCRARTP